MSSQQHNEPAEIVHELSELGLRAVEIGLAEHLLQLAREDASWKSAVERELSNGGPLGKLRRDGRPLDAWRDSLVRRRLLDGIRNDYGIVRAFARTHPVVAGLSHGDDGVSVDSLLVEHGPITGLLAVYGVMNDDPRAQAGALRAALQHLEETENAREAADGDGVAPALSVPVAPAAHDTRLEQALAEIDRLKAEVKELKPFRKQASQRAAEVGRRDEKLRQLREQLRDAEARAEREAALAREASLARDEHRRQAERHKRLASASQRGQRTVETRREEDNKLLQDKVNDLREMLTSSEELRGALETRTARLERQLADERTRREELEETFAAFGIDDIAGSSKSLQDAVEALMRFQQAVGSYAARQQEQEVERARALAEAESERRTAEAARKAQEEMSLAWRLREEQRFIELEESLLQNGPFDHVLIDGHNLVHRVFRPEDESRTRPWLEDMAAEFAEVLEERGWGTRIHLVFDTQYRSNSRTGGHGVEVYFHNNVAEGGADAKIATLLDELNPVARIMVVSTDRRHVWTETLNTMQEQERDVDLVQVELLAQYLQALGDRR